jgi:chitin disaccharide deacetylase
MLARGLLRTLDGRAAAVEAEHQIEAFRSAFGRLPDFIDGHQHVHLLPQVGDALLAVMKARTPAAWVRQCGRTSPFFKRGSDAKAHLLDVLSRRMKSRAAAMGVPTNPGFAGAYNFGHRLNYDAVFASFLDGLPDEGVVMCHPGFVDAELQRLDHLTDMREQEYAFFAGETFPKLLAERGFALA